MDIQEIDTEIADIVQCQSAATVDGQQAVLDAKIAIQELFTRIREIKTKTDMSESMVKEITRDIKQLDHAKKNLTASITTLNHLHMLLSGVEELQSSTKYVETILMPFLYIFFLFIRQALKIFKKFCIL